MQYNAVQLKKGTAVPGLPNFNQGYFNPAYVRADFKFTENCLGNTVQFEAANPNRFDSVQWNFGEPVSGTANTSKSAIASHVYAKAGYYRVQLIIFKTNPCNFSDTINKTIWVGKAAGFLGSDKILCSGDSTFLQSSQVAETYLWNTSANTGSIVVKNSGQYSVSLTLGNCTLADTVQVTVKNRPIFSLGRDTAICLNTSIKLAAVPAYPGSVHLWNNGVTAESQQIDYPGKFSLTITNSEGCQYSDTINITAKQLPAFTLGNDTTICEGTSLKIDAKIAADIYRWNTGATTASVELSNSGLYWCDVLKNGCTYRDSIRLSIQPLHVVNIGRDTTLCNTTSYSINGPNIPGIFEWSTGAIAKVINISASGNYRLKVTNNGCTAADTVKVVFTKQPSVSLGLDKFICEGEKVSLAAAINTNDAVLLWNNGTSANTLIVQSAGQYWLRASNYCGAAADTIIIAKGTCDLLVPNAFSPNGDGINDQFVIKGGDNLKKFQLSIFNRYGQLIFTTANKAVSWNGTFKGQPVTVGTYYYVLNFLPANNNQEQVKSGLVVVLR